MLNLFKNTLKFLIIIVILTSQENIEDIFISLKSALVSYKQNQAVAVSIRRSLVIPYSQAITDFC